MFHELGHAIHNIVSRTKYAIPHSRDFIEIPSIMLEHFTWIPEVLTILGKRYTCLENSQIETEQKGRQNGITHDGILNYRLAEAVART
jgi:metallopeptidase MepB